MKQTEQNEVKHTAGPWHAMPFGKDSQTGWPGESIYGADERRIAEVLFSPHRPAKEGFREAGRPENEHAANVALIVKAPELFEALAAIDKLSCNVPLMSLEVQAGFARNKAMDEYRSEVNGLILSMRQLARQAMKGEKA